MKIEARPRAWVPEPIIPILSLSLGGMYPFPKTCRGTMLMPPAAIKVFFKNARRWFCFVFIQLVFEGVSLQYSGFLFYNEMDKN